MNNYVIFFQNTPTPNIILDALAIVSLTVNNGSTCNHATIS